MATDGSAAELIEQPGAPWSHDFTGDNGPFYNAVAVDNFNHLPDTADATMRDSGEGSEWDFALGAGATKHRVVMWHFEQPSPPLAPVLANAPASSLADRSAAPTFSPQPGDTQLVGYECSLDSAAYAACTSPAGHAALADGRHTFSVRGINAAGRFGPSTTVAWTVGAPTPTPTPTPMRGTPDARRRHAHRAARLRQCARDAPALDRARTQPPRGLQRDRQRSLDRDPGRDAAGLHPQPSRACGAEGHRANQREDTRRRQVRHHTGLHDVRRAAEARHARDAVGPPYALRVSAPA